ncbi:MAG: excinuclease ABC subunit UvrC [Candidatus Methanofastidiosia archaeon]|jgi:excinuclease ABC subunit C
MEFPDKPGVYLMKNTHEIVYIGKAKSLKNRLTSYSENSSDTKIADIMQRTTDIDFFVCENEVDALVLEANLIKEYKPRFNIRLKDDTMYPYLKVTQEEFPRVVVTRDINDGKIFGPFPSAKALRKTMKFMRKLFPLRICKTMKKKECLEYHIGLCPAPCTEKISQKEYEKNVDRIIKFLEGKIDELVQELTEEMEKASDSMDFEKAALIRDRIQALEKSRLTSHINHPSFGDMDVVVSVGDTKKCFTVLMMRGGRLIGKHQYVLEADSEEFFTEFYATHLIPEEVVTTQEIDSLIAKYLQKKRGGPVTVTVPKRGKKKKLVNMAKKEAKMYLKYVYGELELLKDEINLKKVPKRIEGYDVSNIMGTEAAASRVCFINGKPSKKDYRHYKIRVPGIDDYAMMEEVLKRRFKHRENLPDLILIDGGKGHLNVALKTLHGLGLDIPVVALAKKEEEVFTVKGRISDISKKLLIKIRDEAHRFAITYHRTLRRKKLKKSVLDDITGIGEKRKKLLLNYYGSIKNIKKSTLEELNTVLKNKKVAESVYNYLHDIKAE